MPVTPEQLESFHRFGVAQIAKGQPDLSWDELFILWESQSSRADVNKAIDEGIADVEAGRFEPAEQALSDLRSEFGFQE